ncbi:hypothetical protein OPAG_04958 [Rhodococcus opacus PD630]|nr:hypothetical protein OPAG_04958 [Rhodococcus opacus PD630]KXF53555.1 hypothetical protein AXA44_44095 [Rhodococcus sp. SC4]
MSSLVDSRFVALPQGGGNAPVDDRVVFTASVFVVTGLRGTSVVIGRMDRATGSWVAVRCFYEPADRYYFWEMPSTML